MYRTTFWAMYDGKFQKINLKNLLQLLGGVWDFVSYFGYFDIPGQERVFCASEAAGCGSRGAAMWGLT